MTTAIGANNSDGVGNNEKDDGTVKPRFTSQLVPKKSQVNRNDVNRISYSLCYKVECFQLFALWEAQIPIFSKAPIREKN